MCLRMEKVLPSISSAIGVKLFAMTAMNNTRMVSGRQTWSSEGMRNRLLCKWCHSPVPRGHDRRYKCDKCALARVSR